MNAKRKRFVIALKKYLEKSSKSAEVFAGETGFSKDTVWAWLAGRRKPTRGTMNLIGKQIGMENK